MSDPRKPQRRRAPHQKAELKAQILDTARELFSREGMEAVSMRNLASQVGLTPMGLYRYFASKHELVQHIWSDVFEDLLLACRDAAAHRRTPATRLQAFVHAFVGYWLERPQRFRMIFLRGADAPADPERFFSDTPAVRALFDLWDTLIGERLLEAGGDAGTAARQRQLMFCDAVGLLTVLLGLGLDEPAGLRADAVERMLRL